MTQDAPRTKTAYEVERKTDRGTWENVGSMDANNALSAITAVAVEPGEYRAIPLRNITEQAMGNPPPEPVKLVPVDPDQLTLPTTLPDDFVEPPVAT